MRREPIVLFDNGSHQCLMFDDLVSGEGVQSNQFLITDNEQYLLLDPGGDLTYTPLSLELSKHIPVQDLTYIFASHQDPDIIASLDKWLLHTRARVICSKLWARFLPHLTANYLVLSRGINTFDRIIALPDRGQSIPLGKCTLKAVPAHFLHSVGNFQVYDPVSKILFSGDMGASMVDDASPVRDFVNHVPNMEAFHRRYMAGNKACRLWAAMVREMDVEMIVPQHGRPFVGPEMISAFLYWIENLECGLDLMGPEDYQLPK
ncbi:beta-lactamase domain-containing protein [Ectopseudomonas mendocina]|jgi:flavorubredoxin|uniref:FprA family A-type flavoprotein n=2 Tax=Ectopseudomonas mendocina TaxID=300 RepID=A0ABD7RSJ4_ECTME|nr:MULTISPECIES: MBL fold metallo-hydrolase [Pseudomonas]MBL0950122.1 FprA family A-type flavoprotein [Pseudomonas sp.]AEB57211.1 beta-lactamase domain-containing protein [Pseudomonas mendocina NK-01]ALN20408.1 MBL fold metallo-hydrolase [Pseudomonas mendocina S5.2]KER98681.1 beta-lactamase [Pseudomonas mendocina]MDF2074989.1 MBL fold metallo-hydrolase [Pseudomonas mendocina]